jgi:hypothetical protein
MTNIKKAQVEIAHAIRAYIKEAKSRGVVGVTLDHLFLCVPAVPEAYRAFAGTNGRYFYKQEFYVVAGKVARHFLIG